MPKKRERKHRHIEVPGVVRSKSTYTSDLLALRGLPMTASAGRWLGLLPRSG
jgi:hypothetical protein